MELKDKKAFRKGMLLKRDAVPAEIRKAADESRNGLIRRMDEYRNAEVLLFYVSYRSEADTLQLMKEALTEGRCVAVPKVVGQDMVFYRIRSMSQLVEGYKGILEPDGAQAEVLIDSREKASTEGGTVNVQTEMMEFRLLPEHTILFVPGCAFDEKGGRMGYGGGFYDRFMEKYPGLLKVALAYEEQMVTEVPREVHDKCVDIIVTEERILHVNKRK